MIDVVPNSKKGASLASGVANMINSIIGAGILSLPFTFKMCGLVSGVISQMVFALMTLQCFRYLLKSLPLTKTPVCSYEDLGAAALGRPGWYMYNIMAFTNCYGACVGYIVVVGDIVPGLLSEIGFDFGRQLVVVVATVAIIFPLAALPDFSSLQYASSSAIVIYLLFTCALVSLYVGGTPDAPLDPQPALFKADWAALFRAAPISAFAFQAVTSFFPIYQELDHPTPERMTLLSAISVGLAGVIYACAGWAAYGYFGEDLAGDVLLSLEMLDRRDMQLLRLFFGVSICFTYPTMHYAARRSLDQMLFNSTKGDAPFGRLLAETVFIVGTTLMLGLYATHVEVVLGWTGAIASTTLLYVLPPVIFLRLSTAPLSDKVGDILYLLIGTTLGVMGLLTQF
jgi:amino acid permease